MGEGPLSLDSSHCTSVQIGATLPLAPELCDQVSMSGRGGEPGGSSKQVLTSPVTGGSALWGERSGPSQGEAGPSRDGEGLAGTVTLCTAGTEQAGRQADGHHAAVAGPALDRTTITAGFCRITPISKRFSQVPILWITLLAKLQCASPWLIGEHRRTA